MKKITIILLATVFLMACKSSTKQLERGDYDAALKKSAKKIKRNPAKNGDEIYVFNDAYQMAMKRDDATILRLKKQGNPANWGKVFQLYTKMNKRQDLAFSLPPVGIEFAERDFNTDINDARLKAAEYAYAKGTQLLKIDNRFEARKAHGRFLEVKRYEAYYKDVDQKIAEAKSKGITNVFFKIEDRSNVVAPRGLIEEIQRINMHELNETWKNYDTYVDSNTVYHYSIILNLKLIDVSPEMLKENNYTESREVADGFEYILDSKGNVKKDTLGNDIKIPKFRTISCGVKELHQQKTARISGTIDYYDNYNKKLIKSEPVASDAIFEHHYAIANGNVNALKPITIKKIGIDPLPFPADEPLILQAGDVLKTITKDIIVRNKNLLK